MNVEVLGTGCHGCLELELLVGDVLTELGRKDATVMRTTDARAIRRYIPLEAVPGLVIDGRVVSVGTVPKRETLREWLAAA